MVADQPNAQTGSDQVSDRVRLQLDWAPPTQAGRPTFRVRIERRERSSSIEFEVDLLKLEPSELERLQEFLESRHSNRTPASEIAATTAWLLECSLRQTQPSLKRHQRQALVRELLLVRPFKEVELGHEQTR